jgi:putative tricarboxylic transport membrane protein
MLRCMGMGGRLRHIGRIGLVAWALCRTSTAGAWEPTSPVELIVPAGSGGGADQMAHLLQRTIAAHGLMREPVIVINKSNGDGAEAFLHMKANAGNPHKLLLVQSNLFTTPRVSGIPFSYRDLNAVGMLALDHFVLWVNAGSPYATARAYFDAIRAAPDHTFSLGGTGFKQEDQLLTLALEKQLGKKFTYVSFRGGGEVAARLADKQVTCTVNNPGEALERWRAGQLRPLCVLRSERMPYPKQLPVGQAWSDIPACKASGVDIDYRMLRGVFLPSGTSPEQVAFYVALFGRVREQPEWREFVEGAALQDTFSSGAAFAEWLQRADATHEALMREGGLLFSPAAD